MLLLELYLSNLPVTALQCDVFYMKPRGSLPDCASGPWYTNIAVGHNALGNMLKTLLQKAGIDASNSLRATAISRM